jgi:hypothetical protein
MKYTLEIDLEKSGIDDYGYLRGFMRDLGEKIGFGPLKAGDGGNLSPFIQNCQNGQNVSARWKITEE